MLTFYLFLFIQCITILLISCNALYFGLYVAVLFIHRNSIYLFFAIVFIHHNSVYISQFSLYVTILFLCLCVAILFISGLCLYITILFFVCIHRNCLLYLTILFIRCNSICVYILVEYPVSCLNISDGKSCSVLTLLGQQLLHVWKRKGVNRKHFLIQSDTINQLQRFWHFAQDILTDEKLRSSSDSEQRGSEFCFCTSATTPAQQLPVSGFLWNHTTNTERADHFLTQPLHPPLEQTVLHCVCAMWLARMHEKSWSHKSKPLNHQELA